MIFLNIYEHIKYDLYTHLLYEGWKFLIEYTWVYIDKCLEWPVQWYILLAQSIHVNIRNLVHNVYIWNMWYLYAVLYRRTAWAIRPLIIIFVCHYHISLNAMAACNSNIPYRYICKFVYINFFNRCPTTFWITNPRNIYTNNAAAGSEVHI